MSDPINKSLGADEPTSTPSVKTSPLGKTGLVGLGTALVVIGLIVIGLRLNELSERISKDRTLKRSVAEVQSDLSTLSARLADIERAILLRLNLLGDRNGVSEFASIWSCRTAVSQLKESWERIGGAAEDAIAVDNLFTDLLTALEESRQQDLTDNEIRARLDHLDTLRLHTQETLDRMSTHTGEKWLTVATRVETRSRNRSIFQIGGLVLLLGWPIFLLSMYMLYRRNLQLEKQLAANDHHLSLVMRDLNTSRDDVQERDRKRLLGEVAANVAHELGNALMPISAMTELLLQNEELTASQREKCLIAWTACSDATKILSNLRGHMGAPALRNHPVPIHLSTLLHQVIAFTQPRISAAKAPGSQVELRVQDDAQLYVEGVESELRQVFTNLFLNAIDAVGKQGEVTVRSRLDGQDVVIEIIDNGVGLTAPLSLAPEDIRQSTKTQGLGIGLRVCHELLAKHSGSLEIAPGELNGAVTTVRLPACSPPHGATTISQPFKIPSKATYDDLQVLCVDDEQAVLESLTALLSSLGVRVLTTNSGEAALHKFKTQPCDFVICDLDLPDTDGISVLKQMREMNQQSKLGLLTGWDSHPEELSSDWLPDFQLTKPASLEEISEVLQTTESTRSHSSS